MSRNRNLARALNQIDSTGVLTAEDITFIPELTSSVYDSISELTIQSTGSVAYISSTNDLYFSNGFGWIKILKD